MILLVRLVLRLLADVGQFTTLLFKPRQAIAAENLILRRQIALFEERGMKPCRDICHGDRVAARACVLQCKTQRSVQFEITPPARESVEAWIRTAKLQPGDYLVPSRIHNSTHIGTRQYARILHGYAYNIAEMRAYRGESTQLSIGSNGLTASATLSWSLSKLIRN